MERTLEEMKRDRGGHCFQCGKDIMDPLEKDHSFCNACWWDILHHEVTFVEDGLCAECDFPPEDEIHAELSPYRPQILN